MANESQPELPAPDPATPEPVAITPPAPEPIMSFNEFETTEFHPLEGNQRSNLTLETPHPPRPQPPAPSELPPESETT
jgi:hypothetical protein